MTYEEWYTFQWPCDGEEGILRVGQSYLNNVRPGVTMPELFYETDPVKAWDMIEQLENDT